MSKREAEPKMIYKSTLKSEYGFTETLIKKLGDPDDLVVNRNYKSGPPASLYRVDRVKQFIKQHKVEVTQVRAKRKKRQASARKGVETKARKLSAIIETIKLELVRPLPASLDELFKIAHSHAIDRHGMNCAPPGPDGIAATVRHEFTNYDELLAVLEGKCGSGSAYESARCNLDFEIDMMLTLKYPEWTPGRLSEPVSRSRRF